MIRHYKHYGAILHTRREPYSTITEKLLSRASRATGLSVARLTGDERSKKVFFVRAAICLVMRNEYGLALTMIGNKLGDRHHSTVLNACQRAENMRKTDPDFRTLYCILAENVQ